MPPIYLDLPAYPILPAILSGVIAILLFLVVGFFFLWSDKTLIFGMLLITGGAALILGNLYSSFVPVRETREREQDDRIMAIEETYGLKLSPEEFIELEYPWERPGDDVIAQYRAIPLNGTESGLDTTSYVRLVWDRTEFRLMLVEQSEEFPRV